jgi:hypothetical protein
LLAIERIQGGMEVPHLESWLTGTGCTPTERDSHRI